MTRILIFNLSLSLAGTLKQQHRYWPQRLSQKYLLDCYQMVLATLTVPCWQCLLWIETIAIPTTVQHILHLLLPHLKSQMQLSALQWSLRYDLSVSVGKRIKSTFPSLIQLFFTPAHHRIHSNLWSARAAEVLLVHLLQRTFFLFIQVLTLNQCYQGIMTRL